MGLWEQSWCIPHNHDIDVMLYNCHVVFSRVHNLIILKKFGILANDFCHASIYIIALLENNYY